MSEPKLYYNRDEMLKLNKETLQNRANVSVVDIAKIAHEQQGKYYKEVDLNICIESVEKILTFRDVFHHIQFAAEVDRLAEEKMFKGPIGDILYYDYGLFGLDETLGLDVARLYGAIGQTNFGDIDVNKRGIVSRLNEEGKKPGVVHTLMDDIVGAIAAAASTRVAQIMNEDLALENPDYQKLSLFEFMNKKK